MAEVFLLSLFAAVNLSLVAAVTLMLLLPHPKRLLLGYLLGGYMVSITLGLLIVLLLPGSGTESASKHTIGPIEDIVVGLVVLAIAWVLKTRRDKPFEERRRERQDAKLKAKQEAGKATESLATRVLSKGDPRLTFVVGAILSFPGVSYLIALDHIHQENLGTAATVLLVVFFCVMELLLVEIPLVGYAVAPERTEQTVARFRAWLARSGRGAATVGAAAVGVLLILRGVITLL